MPLDDIQRSFVEYQQGAALLHAPVGTGKTLSLAERAAEALRRGVPANRILCVTFTNRAAEELRQRVAARCGDAARDMVVRTFHSLCAWMLRSESRRIGLPFDFAIYDDQDGQEVLTALLRRRSRSRPDVGFVPDVRALYHYIEATKMAACLDQLSPDALPAAVLRRVDAHLRDLVEGYMKELATQHALDFADLILYTRAMLDGLPAVRTYWQERFQLVQVDEMQDTHPAEYLILRELALRTGNLVLAGDFDQTIYEWRGSSPSQILAAFERDFGTVRKFEFTVNYRTTRTLLQATAAVARRFSNHTPPVPRSGARLGEPVGIHIALDETQEAEWIGDCIERLRRETRPKFGVPLPYHRIAVLTRTNQRASFISDVFKAHRVPHVTVETYEFFRRQEIKDVLAYLRLLRNPADGVAFRRILLRPARGIGEGTIEAIQSARAWGLRLVDMIAPSTRDFGEPFGEFLEAYRHGTVTVFDTETTGLVPGRDEIVELAACRLERGRPVATFHRYLRNTVPVGESERVHRLSDQFLSEHGENPAQVLEDFASFAQGSLLAGHNVAFDVRMLQASCARQGLERHTWRWVDTLELARRVLDGDDFSLSALAQRFGLANRPSHRAKDDVATTIELLEHLTPLVERDAAQRRKTAARYVDLFKPLAEELDSLSTLVDTLRPPALIQEVLRRSGLEDYYKEREPRRLDNLAELVHIAHLKDDPDLDPRSAMEAFLQFAALAKNVDTLDPDDERVRVLTVHQSKGLEFDVVFVAGLCDGEFPSYRAVKDGREDEELRIFYVAVTRARERLFLTGHAFRGRKESLPSPFLNILGSFRREAG